MPMLRPGLLRRDLTAPLQTLQGELNRLIEGYWNPLASSGPAANPAGGESAGSWAPAVDLWETPTEIVVAVDLPGVDPATLDLSLAGNLLKIQGTKAEIELVEATEPIRERPTGAFHREVLLTGEVDFDRVQAEAKNGVLTVRMPRQGAARARTIPVRNA